VIIITLRQQDDALLMGAIALFIVLAIVMYVTRKVD
jgi:inner membrane protein involved in colicin E2 resistance